ncbi:MAG: hypothetical protein H0V89_03775 [Deltaproteobacteria bacterium]|nr:hypothetical protein [Deltaproteobacteria bacterium]
MSVLNRALFATVALGLSTTASAGVLIGHPVPFKIADANGITFTSLQLPVSDQVVEYCVGSPLLYAVDDVLGIDDLLGLPAGEICGIDLYLSAPVVITGVGNAGGTFTLTLDMLAIHVSVDPSLVVSTSHTSAADAVTLADLDWISASSLGLATGVHRNIALGDSGYYALRDAVRRDSSIAQ